MDDNEINEINKVQRESEKNGKSYFSISFRYRRN